MRIPRWMRYSLAVAGIAAVVGAALYAAFFRAIPLRTVAVSQQTIELSVNGPGTVQSRIPVTVSTRVTGLIVELRADQGDHVKRGQLLTLLDDSDAVARRDAAKSAVEVARRNFEVAEASTAKARAQLDLARSAHRRFHDLFTSDFISELEMDTYHAAFLVAESDVTNATASVEARRSETKKAAQDLSAAEAALAFTRISAGMDALVIKRLAEVGSIVVPGSPIFQLVDLASLWVVTRIDETVVGLVSIGQPAKIRLRSGLEATGKVARIERQSDAVTRELEVDIAFDHPVERFAIDQEAEVSISTGTVTDLVVPLTALTQREGKRGVLVVRESKTEFQPVSTGPSDSKRVIVTQGLRAGERVIADAHNVRPGTRVGLE